VGDEPEENEIGVSLAGEHRLEIEFEVRLAGEGLVIAEQAKAEAIRDDGPEVTGAAIEELLDEPVGIGGGAANAGGAAIETEPTPDEMDGGGTEEAIDGVGFASDLGAGGGGEEAKAQFTEEGNAPLVIGETGSRLGRAEVGGGGAEVGPVAAEAVPALSDGVVEAFARGEAIVGGGEPGKLTPGVDDPTEKVGRKEAAFRVDAVKVGFGGAH
jgi:hypothetical protein